MNSTNKKLHFFNSEDGWMLRQVVTAHPVRRSKKQFCWSCGINSGNTKKLRPRPNSQCVTCFVNFCTVRNKHEKGLSCFQAWLEKDTLKPRTFYAGTAHSGTSMDSVAEASRSPTPQRPQRTPSPPPQQPLRTLSPSLTPKHDHRNDHRLHRHLWDVIGLTRVGVSPFRHLHLKNADIVDDEPTHQESTGSKRADGRRGKTESGTR